MEENKKLITYFYTCFANKDFAGMQSCYAENAVFNDEVFRNLTGEQPGKMWEMLIRSGKDLTLEFSEVVGTKAGGSARWIATYTFSKTGRVVVNDIHAQFEIENGKIIKHIDQFDFYKWAKQAFGITGILIGWTSFFKNKVRATASSSLNGFLGN